MHWVRGYNSRLDRCQYDEVEQKENMLTEGIVEDTLSTENHGSEHP
jgi:hypothetical protein